MSIRTYGITLIPMRLKRYGDDYFGTNVNEMKSRNTTVLTSLVSIVSLLVDKIRPEKWSNVSVDETIQPGG